MNSHESSSGARGCCHAQVVSRVVLHRRSRVRIYSRFHIERATQRVRVQPEAPGRDHANIKIQARGSAVARSRKARGRRIGSVENGATRAYGREFIKFRGRVSIRAVIPRASDVNAPRLSSTLMSPCRLHNWRRVRTFRDNFLGRSRGKEGGGGSSRVCENNAVRNDAEGNRDFPSGRVTTGRRRATGLAGANREIY